MVEGHRAAHRAEAAVAVAKRPPPLLSLPTGGSTSDDAGSATPRLHFVMFSKSAYIRIFSLLLPVVHGLSEGTESTVNVLSEKVDLLKKVFDSLTMSFTAFLAARVWVVGQGVRTKSFQQEARLSHHQLRPWLGITHHQ